VVGIDMENEAHVGTRMIANPRRLGLTSVNAGSSMSEGARNAIEGKLDEIICLLGKLASKDRPKPRRLLRVAEAAEYLHISPSTLRGIIQRGELPIVKLGENDHSPWLLDVRDLDEWVNRTKTTV
jgi:excisionase family DNA binding protein